MLHFKRAAMSEWRSQREQILCVDAMQFVICCAGRHKMASWRSKLVYHGLSSRKAW